jgi:hemolysin activation/secretion protein
MLRQEKQSARAIRQLLNWQVCRRTSATLVFIAPTALALATTVSSPVAPASAVMVDTGISKIRSGKATIRAAMPSLKTDRESLRLSLDGFRVEGDPRLVPEALDDVLAPWRGKMLSFSEYEQAIHAVAAYLRANGHPGAQVRMSRALVGGGAVMIAIDGLAENKPVIAAAEVIPKIDVKRFKFSGVTLVPESELQTVLAELSGKPIIAAEMEEAAKKVANYMRAKGYPLVQAYLAPQRVDTGEIEITVQEGRLDGTVGRNGVTVASKGERVKTEVIEEFLMRGAKSGEALRVVDLERVVLLASDLPGIKSVTTQIEPGSQPGTTQLKATVEEAKVFASNVMLDNYGSRYTGETRLLGHAQFNSPLGYGEQLSINVVSSSLMSSARLGAQAPVGTNGFKVGAAYSSMRSNFGLDMAILDLNSQADIASLFLSYPLIRSAENNVNVGLNHDNKHLITDLTWGRENDRKINLTTLGASGDFIDKLGGQTRWSSSLGVGNLDLSGHALYADTDSKTAKTQGSFTKLNWQATRLAAVQDSKLWTWQMGVSGQSSGGNLDSSEKFQLGGPTGVRAYPVGEGLGDKGWLANLELRYRVNNIPGVNTQLFGFYDIGGIDQYANPWQPTTNNSYTLQGAGVGASFAIGETSEIKLMVARKVGSNPNASPAGNDTDGQNSNTRVWIVGSIVF